MRSLLCFALLLTLLAPTAAAHTDPPQPPNWVSEEIPCDQVLPLYDSALCMVGWAESGASVMAPWAEEVAYFAVHVVGCHVVGGPACIA